MLWISPSVVYSLCRSLEKPVPSNYNTKLLKMSFIPEPARNFDHFDWIEMSCCGEREMWKIRSLSKRRQPLFNSVTLSHYIFFAVVLFVMAEKVMLIIFFLRLDKLPHCARFSQSNLWPVSTPRVNYWFDHISSSLHHPILLKHTIVFYLPKATWN